MILLNFGRPLSDRQLAQVLALTRRDIDEVEVYPLPIRVIENDPLVPQVVALVDRCPLGPTSWQRHPILVNPPGYAPLALVLIAELHGRMGHFPALIRIRPIEHVPYEEYEVGEIINLQSVRKNANTRSHVKE